MYEKDDIIQDAIVRYVTMIQDNTQLPEHSVCVTKKDVVFIRQCIPYGRHKEASPPHFLRDDKFDPDLFVRVELKYRIGQLTDNYGVEPPPCACFHMICQTIEEEQQRRHKRRRLTNIA